MFFPLFSGLLIGFALGFVMQRGRFCMAGGLRDIYMEKDYRMFIALMIAITIQSIGLFAFVELGWVKLPSGTFPWLATIIGGLIFGAGMAFAGTCSTGAYYRAAEGLWGSILAVVGFMLSSYLIRLPEIKNAVSPVTSVKYSVGTIDQTFNISPWICVLALTVITGTLVWRYLQRPKVFIPQLKAKKTGLAHLLLEARWHPFVTALIIGVIALLAWVSSLATGRVGGLGISGPSAQFVDLLLTGNQAFFKWPGLLLIGIVLGSFVAAKGRAEFRFRYPGHTVISKSLFGGFLMGIGSGLAGGCLLGNALVGTAYMSWQGWLFIPMILLGSWFVNYFTLLRSVKLSYQG